MFNDIKEFTSKWFVRKVWSFHGQYLHDNVREWLTDEKLNLSERL